MTKTKDLFKYVDGVKFYLQISEEISFISKDMIFLMIFSDY